MQQLMFSSAELPASRSQSLDSGEEWPTRAETWPLCILRWLTDTGPSGWFGRTSPASCQAAEDGTLVPSSGAWLNSGMGSPTECLTLSTSEWPSDAAVCSLSDILETGDLPQRFYLSQRACAGILRRAERRGKDVAPCLDASFGRLQGCSGQDANHGHGHLITSTPLVPVAFSCRDHGADAGDIAPTLRAMGHDGSHANGGGQVAVAFYTTQITSKANRRNPQPGDPCHTLAKGAHAPAIAFGWQNSESQGDSVSEHITPTLDKSKTPAVAYDMRGRDGGATMEGPHDTANIRAASGGSSRSYLAMPSAVRRLTPRECERLQGFADDFTAIPWRGTPADKCPDGPRYKALGNSMAVPCMAWIGKRIEVAS
jgi:hypothetical protein